MTRRPLAIEELEVHVLALPTADGPESDGTLEWDATTMVLVECRAAGVTGLGYTYANAAAARVIETALAPCVRGGDPAAIPALAQRMHAAVRNQGARGLCAMAISAVDIALWDLAARLHDVPLAEWLGLARREVPVYASGGFTSTGLDGLAREIAEYVAQGHTRVKIKVGRDPDTDEARVRVAREAAGPLVELMVDANNGYERKQALAMAERFAAYGVTWFEEPIAAADLDGLRLLRDRAPAGMAIAGGEYGYELEDFDALLGAVDVVQADVTRCLGVTGFRQVDALCAARAMRLSSHCAPALHAHVAAAATQLRHLECFRDHVRFEALVFDGAPRAANGVITYDRRRAGLGLELRHHEARRHAV